MRQATRQLLRRGEDLRKRTRVEIGPTGPRLSFATSAQKVIDDVMIDFQSRAVLWEEGEFELPQRVEKSLNEMRKLCVTARQALAGTEPFLSEPLDRIEQACSRFVHRHPAAEGAVDFGKPLAPDVLEDLLALRVEIAEIADALHRATGLPSAQQLLKRINFDELPRSPWPGYA